VKTPTFEPTYYEGRDKPWAVNCPPYLSTQSVSSITLLIMFGFTPWVMLHTLEPKGTFSRE